MFAPALRIALAKTDNTVPSEALARALVDAESLKFIESEFESKINSSKAKRAERPTRLSKPRKAQVDQYSADAASLQAQQLAEFQEMTRAAVVMILKSGLETDLQFWTNVGKHIHPADLPVVEELVNAKRALEESLSACVTAISTTIAS